MREDPVLNISLDGKSIHKHDDINIGLAVALGLLLVTETNRPWMLGVFLVATIAGLAAELLVLTPALRAANRSNPNAHSTATHSPETAG